MLGRQKEERVAENEMVRWHQGLSGHETEQTHEIVEDRGAWHAADHEVAQIWTQLSD